MSAEWHPGWYCEFTNIPGEPMLWSFGPAGSSLFNISFDEELGYALFDYEEDSTKRFSTIDELGKWLYTNEGRHADHTRKLRYLAATQEWAILKNVGFDVRVTFDDDIWIATVRGLPVVMSAARPLPAPSLTHAKRSPMLTMPLAPSRKLSRLRCTSIERLPPP